MDIWNISPFVSVETLLYTLSSIITYCFHHFPLSFASFSTQIITLVVIKHDQVSFANGWLFCLVFDILTGIPQPSADSATICWFRSHMMIPQPFCWSQGSTCYFAERATWACWNICARGSCAISSASHVICTSGQRGSSYGQIKAA